MPDSRKKLYDQLSSQYDLGTFDQFNAKMDSPESRKKLYDAISGEYDLGDYKTFESKVVQTPPLTGTVRSQLPETAGGRVGQTIFTMAQALSGMPGMGMVGPIGAAIGGGVRTIANAFQPQVTPAGGVPRLLESAGRGGEVLLGAAQIAGAPLAPLAPLAKPIESALSWAIQGSEPYKMIKAASTAARVPEVAQTAEDVAKLGGYVALGEAIPKGFGVLRSGAEAGKKFSPAAPKLPKPDVQFLKGAERTSARGGLRTQAEDINLVRADLSHAFREGLDPSPTKFVSEKLQEKIQSHQDAIFGQELETARAHPNEQVYLGGKTLSKLKTDALERADPSAFATIDDLAQRYDRTVGPEQALNDLRQINNEIAQYYKSVGNANEPPPFSAKELAFKEQLATEMRKNYIDAMENAGVKGVRESRLRWGSLEGVKNDIILNKNKIDQLPAKLLEQNVGTKTLSVHGRIIDNLLGFLKKTPADYVTKAARGWAEMGLEPSGIRNLGGLLPSKGVTPPPVPPLGVEDIPNPRLPQAPSQRVPESFIRGTGKEALDVQRWQQATSATPEQIQYVGPVEELPSFGSEFPGSRPEGRFGPLSPQGPSSFTGKSLEELQRMVEQGSPSELKGSDLAHAKGRRISGDSKTIRARWEEFKKAEAAIKEQRAAAMVSKDKAAINELMRKAAENNLIREEVEGALGADRFQSFKPEETEAKIKALESKSAPPAAQKAKDKADKGGKLTLRERNLIRQHYPQLADRLFA